MTAYRTNAKPPETVEPDREPEDITVFAIMVGTSLLLYMSIAVAACFGASDRTQLWLGAGSGLLIILAMVCGCLRRREPGK